MKEKKKTVYFETKNISSTLDNMLEKALEEENYELAQTLKEILEGTN